MRDSDVDSDNERPSRVSSFLYIVENCIHVDVFCVWDSQPCGDVYSVAVLGRGKGAVAPPKLAACPLNIPFAPTWNLYWIHSVKDTLQLNHVCLKLHTKITTTKHYYKQFQS